jgi:ribosome-associated toxin RatA of RatAB toxin-antitoxin module
MDDVLACVRDVAAQPTWWPGMVSADVLESDDQGRTVKARIVNDVKVAKDKFEVTYEHTDTTVTWNLVAPSRAQKMQQGSWTLAPKGNGTEATLDLTVDSSLPLPGFVQRKVVGDQVKGATEGLKKKLGG